MYAVETRSFVVERKTGTSATNLPLAVEVVLADTAQARGEVDATTREILGYIHMQYYEA